MEGFQRSFFAGSTKKTKTGEAKDRDDMMTQEIDISIPSNGKKLQNSEKEKEVGSSLSVKSGQNSGRKGKHSTNKEKSGATETRSAVSKQSKNNVGSLMGSRGKLAPAAVDGTGAVVNKSDRNRAKVTVQRRGAGGQKVVSLSFEEEVGGQGKKPEIKSTKELEGKAATAKESKLVPTQPQKLPMTLSDECSDVPNLVQGSPVADPSVALPVTQAVFSTPCQPFSTALNSSVEEIEESSSDCVIDFPVPLMVQETTECLAPPPIRFRQAWASPSTSENRKSNHTHNCRSAMKSTDGHVDDEVRNDKAVEGKSTEVKNLQVKSRECEDSASDEDSEESSETDEVSEDTQKEYAESVKITTEKVPVKSKRVDDSVPFSRKKTTPSRKLELSSTRQDEINSPVNEEGGLKKHVEETKKKAEKGPVSISDIISVKGKKLKGRVNKSRNTHCKESMGAEVGVVEDTTIQGKGDMKVTDDDVKPESSGKETGSGSCEQVSVNKGLRLKKKVSSFLSWTHLKKGPSSKVKKSSEKSSKPNLECYLGDEQGDVTKASMASEILRTQTKMNVPYSITDMFTVKEEEPK